MFTMEDSNALKGSSEMQRVQLRPGEKREPIHYTKMELLIKGIEKINGYMSDGLEFIFIDNLPLFGTLFVIVVIILLFVAYG